MIRLRRVRSRCILTSVIFLTFVWTASIRLAGQEFSIPSPTTIELCSPTTVETSVATSRVLGHSDSAAAWIWDEPNAHVDSTGSTERFFRIAFDVDQTPNSAQLQIATDDQFTAYLNGKTIGADSDWKSIETFENIQAMIKPGHNVLSFRANNLGGPAGLIGLLRMDFDNGVIKWAATNEKTKVKQAVTRNDWNEISFDDADWETATELGKPGEAWSEVVSGNAFTPKASLIRGLANELLAIIQSGPDAVAGNAIIDLVHLAADHADYSLWHTLDPKSAPRLMDVTIHVVTSHLYSPSRFRQCSSRNALHLLLKISAATNREDLTLRLLHTNRDYYRANEPNTDHLQLIVLAGIDDVLENLLVSYTTQATALADKEKELKSKEAEIKAIKTKIEAVKTKIKSVGTPPDGTTSTHPATIQKIVAQYQAEAAVFEAEKSVLDKEKTTLEQDRDKLAVNVDLYIKRANEIIAFLDDVQSDHRSPAVLNAFQSIRSKAAANRLAFYGVGSYAKSMEFMNSATRGTADLIGGIGGPVAASELPSATSPTFVTEGDQPGVSNTAPYAADYRPWLRTDSPSYFDAAGKRTQRNKETGESGVGGADPAAGALPKPPAEEN